MISFVEAHHIHHAAHSLSDDKHDDVMVINEMEKKKKTMIYIPY